MRGKRDRIEEIADGGYLDVAVALGLTLSIFLFFFFSLLHPHFVIYSIWCAPLGGELSLSQLVLLVYAALLNWLAIRFYVIRNPAFGTGWGARFAQLAVLILAGTMTYNLYVWNNRLDCRLQREADLRQVMVAMNAEHFVPPAGLRPYTCGWPQRQCWTPDTAGLILHSLDRKTDELDRSGMPKPISATERMDLASASDEELSRELEKCLLEIDLSVRPDIMLLPDSKGFDFTFLRNDPWGRVLIVAFREWNRRRDLRLYPRVHFFLDHIGDIYLPPPIDYICYFDGAHYSHFEDPTWGINAPVITQEHPNYKREWDEAIRLNQSVPLGIRSFRH